jgi:hypothetical protein
MENDGRFTCAVDIALCIDITASMQPAIDMVKSNALKLHGDLIDALAKKDREVTELRLKVIAFRDVEVDAVPFEISEWFSLPAAESEFRAFVTKLTASGGGDEPESGLDALSIAIRSDWTKTCDRQRHVVVLWTDATSKPPSGGKTGSIPTQVKPLMAASKDELSDMWNDPQGSGSLKATAKRMVIYGPDCPDWNELQEWDEVNHYASRAGQGLRGEDYNSIIEVLAGSIA